MIIIFTAQYLYIAAVVIGATFLFTRPKRIQKSMAICGAIIGSVSYGISRIASLLYYDPRPFVMGHFTPLITHAADNGFPSDHTLLVAALAMTLWFYDKRLSWWVWLVAILVGLARVVSGVHYLTDIIGSIVIVLIVGVAYHFFRRKYDLT
jgi:undecaprenyl-diphosphatase